MLISALAGLEEQMLQSGLGQLVVADSRSSCAPR
jgi:hypothetical protein